MSQEQCPVCNAVLLSGCAYCTTCGAKVAQTGSIAGTEDAVIVSTHRGMPIPDISDADSCEDADELGPTLVDMAAIDLSDPQKLNSEGHPDVVEMAKDSEGVMEASPAPTSQNIDVPANQLDASLEQTVEPREPPTLSAHFPIDGAVDTPVSQASKRNDIRLFFLGGLFISIGFFLLIVDTAKVYEDPLTFGQPEFKYSGDLVRVRLPVQSELAVMMSYPGGRRAVSDEVDLPFSLNRTNLELGERTLDFEARVGVTTFPVNAQISALYKMEVVDASATSIELQLTHDAAHFIRVSPGRLESLTETNHLWVIDIPAGEDFRSIPVEIIVGVPGEAPITFKDEILRPNLSTPLSLIQPSSPFLPSTDSVDIVGYTLPGAEVSSADLSTTADAVGRFSLDVPRVSKGPQNIEVRVQADGREMTSRSFVLATLSEEEKQALLKRQRAELENVRLEYGTVEEYAHFENLDVQSPVLLTGQVLSRQRRTSTSIQLIFSMCPNSQGCLVWLDYEGTDLSDHDDKVIAAGVFVGEHTYEAEDGKRRTIPRMDARLVVPL